MTILQGKSVLKKYLNLVSGQRPGEDKMNEALKIKGCQLTRPDLSLERMDLDETTSEVRTMKAVELHLWHNKMGSLQEI